MNLLLPRLQADLGFFFATSLLLRATICAKMFKNLLDYGPPQTCSLLHESINAMMSITRSQSGPSLMNKLSNWVKQQCDEIIRSLSGENEKTDQRREAVKRFDKATLNTKRLGTPSRSLQPLDVLQVSKVIATSYV